MLDRLWQLGAIILASVILILGMLLWSKSNSYNLLQVDYDKLQAEYVVLDIQKAALVKGIEIQNDTIRQDKLDTERSLLVYKNSLVKTTKELETQLAISRQLKTDAEICEYMKRRSYEILSN